MSLSGVEVVDLRLEVKKEYAYEAYSDQNQKRPWPGGHGHGSGQPGGHHASHHIRYPFLQLSSILCPNSSFDCSAQNVLDVL